MKKLAWLQVFLGALATAAMAYVLYWSMTGLVSKLEGPAFPGQSGASHWVPVHPGSIAFARWYIPVTLAFAVAVLVVAEIQVLRKNGYGSRLNAALITIGFVIGISAIVLLLDIRPDQWQLSNGEGVMMLDMAASMWGASYSVLDFMVVIIGPLVAAVGIIQWTLATREETLMPVRTGWKSARNTTRRRR